MLNCANICELHIAFGVLRMRVKLKGRITEDRKQLYLRNSRLHQKKEKRNGGKERENEEVKDGERSRKMNKEEEGRSDKKRKITK